MEQTIVFTCVTKKGRPAIQVSNTGVWKTRNPEPEPKQEK